MHPDTRGTRSSSSWMTPQWWGSFINEISVYREEVKLLEGWCRENNLVLIADKTKEMIDFRRSKPERAPLSISGCTVERVENIKFPGVQISQDLSWNKNTSGITKRAQQRLYFSLSASSRPSTVVWWRAF